MNDCYAAKNELRNFSYKHQLVASGLIYPLSKEINAEKAHSESLYGNNENEIKFIVDGIYVTESLSMKDIIENEAAFIERVSSVINFTNSNQN